MKIYFDNVDWNSRSGPNTFAGRLAQALANRGHVLADINDYDVALCFIEPQRINYNKPFVLRLDGIWFAPNEFETKNIYIKQAYKHANHVIFQSQFDKTFITKHWGLPQQHNVINNGIDLQNVDKILTNNNNILLTLKDQYEKVLICSANWHNQKRLNANYALFDHIRNTLNVNCCLIVMGSNPHQNPIKHLVPHTFYTGNIPHEDCLKVFSVCDYMLHLAYLDHSPNAVVEALACKCPVICSEDGGTIELVNQFGMSIKEQQKYEHTLEYYDNPPSIDVTQVTMLPYFTDVQYKLARQNLDIQHIALQYEKTFQNLI